MKANEFVMRFGWDDAMEYLCGASFSEVDGTPITPCVNDLKRLVESHELVEFYGGYELAKNVRQITPLRKASYDLIENLKQAIADVESCQ